MDLRARLRDLRLLMVERAEARGPTLAAQLRRRRLPRALRGDARFLAQAEALAAHPRTARLVDPRAAARAHDRLARHLRGLDPRAARRRRRLDTAALIAFYVLVTWLGLLAWLASRG
jgi:hypothetical protein